MHPLFYIIGLLIIAGIVLAALKGLSEREEEKEQPKYQYKKRNYFLTRAEHECFNSIVEAAGTDYYVFAQVHLPTLLDNKVVGQNWRGAFRHISEKSVDFVVCDRKYLSPKLAVELDDKTHERADRQERDKEVERILQDAGVPLLRLENHGSFNSNELALKIRELALK